MLCCAVHPNTPLLCTPVRMLCDSTHLYSPAVHPKHKCCTSQQHWLCTLCIPPINSMCETSTHARFAPQHIPAVQPQHRPCCTPWHSLPCCADTKQQLLACKEDQQQLQQQLQASQDDSSSLQARLDAAITAKQEAEGLCLHLREEVRQLQGQLTSMRHSASLCQSQQLELQVNQFKLHALQLQASTSVNVSYTTLPYTPCNIILCNISLYFIIL